MISEVKKNEYMDLLNIKNEAEVLNQIKDLSSSLSNHEHVIRSCIFDLHAAVEVEIRRIYFWHFKNILTFTTNKEENIKTKKDFEKMIEKLSFMDMWRPLRPIMINTSYCSFENIQHINDTRNQSSHTDISKVFYKGRSPFKDMDSLCEMYFDVWAIKQEIPKFFERVVSPSYRCRAYYEKYGDIGISKSIKDAVDNWYDNQ